MEQNSPVEILETQIRESFARVVWTHKTQEKCADILNKRKDQIKVWQILLSALTTSGILVTVFGDQQWVGISTALISTALLGLNTYTKNYDLGELAQKHANCATFLWNVRETYFSLLADIRAGVLSEDAIRERRDHLQKEVFSIYKGSPRTISAAYNKATKALKKNEELTFTDEEIDVFLPKALRKVLKE